MREMTSYYIVSVICFKKYILYPWLLWLFFCFTNLAILLQEVVLDIIYLAIDINREKVLHSEMVWWNFGWAFEACPEPRVVYVRTFLLWNVGCVWIEKEKQLRYFFIALQVICFSSPLHPIGIMSFEVVLLKSRCLTPVNMDASIKSFFNVFSF